MNNERRHHKFRECQSSVIYPAEMNVPVWTKLNGI